MAARQIIKGARQLIAIMVSKKIHIRFFKIHTGGAGRVVDHAIQPSECFDRLLHHLGRLVSGIEAAVDTDGSSADVGDHFIDRFGPAAMDGYFCPKLCTEAGGVFANTGIGTGNKDDFISKIG